MTSVKKIVHRVSESDRLTPTEPNDLSGTPSAASGEDARQSRAWWRRSWMWKVSAATLAGLCLIPTQAHSQFGIDIAAILAGLSKIESLMSTYVAAPLKTINKTQQSIAGYEQDVVYPITAINQARSSVAQFESQLGQIGGLFRLNVSSATLPQSRSLESVLLSRNPANVSTVSPQFQSVYGAVMPPGTASPEVRNMTDMTDAQAQNAMKRAIEIDALADAELAQADRMGQQITTAAPGSAPILEAEADVWLVRANAYTQAALAELMRTRAIDMANQSKLTKLGATDSTGNNGLINGSLTNR